MGFIINLIIKDKITKVVYKTPEHKDDRKRDDYHSKIKEDLIQQLPKKIINVFGHNGNFQIENGKIIYVCQKFDEQLGRRKQNAHRTELLAEDYFVKVGFLIVRFINRYTKQNTNKISIHLSFVNENYIKIIID
jgi:hypothetical protein